MQWRRCGARHPDGGHRDVWEVDAASIAAQWSLWRWTNRTINLWFLMCMSIKVFFCMLADPNITQGAQERTKSDLNFDSQRLTSFLQSASQVYKLLTLWFISTICCDFYFLSWLNQGHARPVRRGSSREEVPNEAKDSTRLVVVQWWEPADQHQVAFSLW